MATMKAAPRPRVLWNDLKNIGFPFDFSSHPFAPIGVIRSVAQSRLRALRFSFNFTRAVNRCHKALPIIIESIRNLKCCGTKNTSNSSNTDRKEGAG